MPDFLALLLHEALLLCPDDAFLWNKCFIWTGQARIFIIITIIIVVVVVVIIIFVMLFLATLVHLYFLERTSILISSKSCLQMVFMFSN